MRQTLFTIPATLGGVPVFGFGWLLGLWGVVSLATLAWQIKRNGWSREVAGYLPVLAISGAAIALVLPNLMDSAGLPIRGYGVMLLIAVSASVGLLVHRARQMGIDPEVVLSLSFWLFVAGIVGARVFYIIEYWNNFQKDTLGATLAAMINVTQGGLVVYGSLLAGGAALVVFVYKYRLPGLALSDLVAPCVVLGVALGRIGCFLNGCCYGGLCEVPWAASFPEGSPPFVDQIHTGQIYGLVLRDHVPEEKPLRSPEVVRPDGVEVAYVQPDSPAASLGLKAGDRIESVNDQPARTAAEAQKVLQAAFAANDPVQVKVAGQNIIKRYIGARPNQSRPIHPTQIYSLIDGLLLCFFLLAYYPYRRREGELTALTLTIHPISRFLLEIIRIDESAVFHTGLSISQNISLILLAGASVCWIYVLRRPAGTVWPSRAAA